MSRILHSTPAVKVARSAAWSRTRIFIKVTENKAGQGKKEVLPAADLAGGGHAQQALLAIADAPDEKGLEPQAGAPRQTGSHLETPVPGAPGPTSSGPPGGAKPRRRQP